MTAPTVSTVPSLKTFRKVTCLLVSMAHLSVFAAPAQDPLLTASAGPKPNVVLMLDDSGSMNFTSAPTEVQDPTNVSQPIRPRLHPDDINDGGRNTSGTVSTGTVGFSSAQNVYAAIYRSANTNGLYYNPNVVYEPWPANMRNTSLVDANGYIIDYTKTPIFPEGCPTTTPANRCFVDLIGPLTAGYIDKENQAKTRVQDRVATRWCASTGTRTSDFNCATSTSGSFAFNPMVYFTLNSGEVGYDYTRPYKLSDFTRVDINAISNATLKAAQQKNFAVWFTYYRNRLLMAKGAIAFAFNKQPDSKFRLGYGAINKSPRIVKGVTTFDDKTSAAHRTTFMQWVRDLDANGGTPLRASLQTVGEYYKTDAPYRTDPTSNTSPMLSCRRNYSILVTDGYWNDTGTVTAADEDGNSGETFTTTINGQTFSYRYTKARPYQDRSSGSGISSATLADIAMYYWKNDLKTLDNNIPLTSEAVAAPNSPDNNPAFWQHMVNFTVGLGVDGSVDLSSSLGSFDWPRVTADTKTTVDDLWHAAVNSRGKYLSAKDPLSFANSLSNILSNITSTGGTISGVAVSRATLASGSATKYEPSFEPNKWSGDLTAVSLSKTGAESNILWKASANVPAYDKRNLWTKSASSAMEFTFANLTGTTPLGHIGTGVAPTFNANLVNYLRGDTTNEGGSSGKFRPRKTFTLSDNVTVKTNVLGDMVNSLPVYIKATDFGNRFLPATVNGRSTGSATYSTFLKNKRARAGLIVVGANDGMLHGFRATDGAEMFGYIPQSVLKGESHPRSTASNLYGLARLSDQNYEHQFYVDGQIAEGDISDCSGSSCSWKNIVVASTGGGAKSVFGLNVTSNFANDNATDPNVFGANHVLWELQGSSDADLGYVMSPPEIGMLPNGQWAAVFGNGYDSTNGKAVLYVVNALTGSVIKRIVADAGTGNGLGGVRLVRDNNNIIRHAYAGDVSGNLWKFNMTDLKVDMGGTPLFKATVNNTAQPITATPNYALHPKRGLMVVVPTGMLYSGNDAAAIQQQTIYGLWDQAAIGTNADTGATIQLNELNSKVVQNSTGSVFSIINDTTSTTPAISRGWRLRMLFSSGEQGLYMPQFLNGYTYVETVKPGQLSTESCSLAEGSGYAYLINTFTGAEASKPIIDLNGDGTFSAADKFGVFQRNSVGRGAEVTGGETPPPENCTGDACKCTGPDCEPDDCIANESVCKKKARETDLSDRYWREVFWIIN